MSRPFSHYSAKSSFANVNEPLDASSYTEKKRLKSTFCQSDLCYPNKNMGSQSNFLFLRSTNSTFNPCVNFDKTQLYINLYTKLDLSDLSGNTPVISDLSGNTFPVIIDTSVTPYLKYNIDPSGVLFGNNTCGIDNYLNYVKYDITSNSVI
jgi:hypothetical protein